MIIETNKKNIVQFGDVKLSLTLLNSRMLGVKTNIALDEQIFEDSILGLAYKGDPILEVSDKIRIYLTTNSNFQTEYTINDIVNTKFFEGPQFIQKYDYILPEAAPNKIETYGLPVLGQSGGFFSVNKYLVSVYIEDSCNVLYLKYRYSTFEAFKLLEEDLTSHPNYISSFPKGYFHVMYTFGVPLQYKEDIQKILAGKYSEISPAMKRKIISFYNAKEDSFVSQVINKGELLRKQREQDLAIRIPSYCELESKPNLQLELWNDSLEKNGGIN